MPQSYAHFVPSRTFRSISIPILAMKFADTSSMKGGMLVPPADMLPIGMAFKPLRGDMETLAKKMSSMSMKGKGNVRLIL